VGREQKGKKGVRENKRKGRNWDEEDYAKNVRGIKG